MSLVIFVFFPLAAQAMADALLTQIRQTHATRGEETAKAVARGYRLTLREEGGTVWLPVIVNREVSRAPGFAAKLKRAGARLDSSSRSYARLLVPVSRLKTLTDAFPAEQLRAPIPVTPASGLGSVVSESVLLTAADGYQAGTLTGTGVRVAVVDLGFNGLANAIAAGELPQNTVGVDFTGTGIESGGNHGVGVAEHVVDMAPGVQLYCLRISDLVSMENAADYMRDNNINIANHSVGWVTASYYDDSGPVNDIINRSYDNDGVFWSVSSGNSARRHWRGSWLDIDGDDVLDFVDGDELMELSGSASTVSIFLNWNQYGFNSKTDLNLFVLDKDGGEVARSDVNQSRFNDPVELVTFSYQSSRAPYSVRVAYSDGTDPSGLDITLFSFNHNFEHWVAESSLMDPANAHGAFTVGAVNQLNWQQANPPIRSYSSQGPTNDGRPKPDLVAPDGTASMTFGVSNGTSFSTPTTAGAAALLTEQNGWSSPADLADLLRTQAQDTGAADPDFVYGAGKLQLPLIDSDGDGLTNVEEIALGTDALDADSDDDDLSDFDEDRLHGTDPRDADSDDDGLDDAEEVTVYYTDPLTPDSDGDGLSDFDEVAIYGTDPLSSNRGDLAPRGMPNGAIDAGDVVVLNRLVSGGISPTPGELVLGDLNDNGGLDSGDLVLLMRVLNGDIPLP
ncbi:S8 family serine peptidase [Thiogranum longum]